MPTPPYAKVLAAVNGGAPSSGGITVPGGALIALSGENTSFWQGSPRWEIYDYPASFSAPAGWLTDANGVIYSNAVTPQSFTLAAAASGWGKYMIRLTVNNGTVAQGLVDEMTCLSMLSPNGLHGAAFNETLQFGGARAQWAAELQATLTALESLLTGTSALSPNPKPQSLLANFTCTTNASGGATNLSQGVAVNDIWIVDFGGSLGCSSTGGVKVALICPTGASVEGGVMGVGATSGSTSNAARFVDGSTYVGVLTAQAAVFPVRGTARIKIDATHPGNIVFSVRPVTNGQTATAEAGFWMSCRKAVEV